MFSEKYGANVIKFFAVPVFVLVVNILCVIPNHARAQAQSETNFSITISGGVSLGVYEAGLNWGLIEAIKLGMPDHNEKFNLASISGASAGSVNTVLSAAHYCSKNESTRELFYNAWNLDILNLMPPDGAGYDNFSLVNGDIIPDALFTRSALKEQLESITNLLNRPVFKKGCSVPLGIVVTKSKAKVIPFSTKPLETEIDVQKFVIPVEAYTEAVLPNGDGSLKFRNVPGFFGQKSSSDQYLSLPGSVDGVVPTENVIKAIMASSAFPLAFSKIELDFCYSNDLNDGVECTVDNAETASFIDGGVYDNIPLRVAVELSDHYSNEIGNFIFIDPRKTSFNNEVEPDIPNPTYSGIRAHVRTIVPALDGLRKQELNATIGEYFTNSEASARRTLLLTERSEIITGELLANFGAFMDESYRKYDFAIGILDAARNVASYICDYRDAENTSVCSIGKRALTARYLNHLIPSVSTANCPKDDDVCEILQFHYAELASDAEAQGSHIDSPAQLVAKVLYERRRKSSRPRYESYESFIADVNIFGETLVKSSPELGEQIFKKFSPLTQNALADFKSTQSEMVDAGLRRLTELEKEYKSKENSDLGNAFSALRTLFPQRPITLSNFVIEEFIQPVGSPYRARPGKFGKFLTYFGPDYIGLNGGQSGATARWTFADPIDNLRLRTFLEISGGFTPAEESNIKRFQRYGMGLSYVWDTGEFGVSEYGLSFIIGETNSDSQRWASGNSGIEFSFKTLGNKLEFTIGGIVPHSSSSQGHFVVRIGISDMDSLYRQIRF